jgi:hypothetical protein
LGRQLDPITVRQADVHEGQIKPLLLDSTDGFHAPRRLHGGVAHAPQRGAHTEADTPLVVDHEDPPQRLVY